MYLKPSAIHYSQDSINNHFTGAHSFKRVGETLDDICEYRCTVEDIPTIRVVLRNGVWVTSDNRRLWVFRHLERLGKCTQVPVYQTRYISLIKLTSTNNGESVTVRRHPGGRWYLKQNAPEPPINRYVSLNQNHYHGTSSNTSIRSSSMRAGISDTRSNPSIGRYGTEQYGHNLQNVQNNRLSTNKLANSNVSDNKVKHTNTTLRYVDDSNGVKNMTGDYDNASGTFKLICSGVLVVGALIFARVIMK